MSKKEGSLYKYIMTFLYMIIGLALTPSITEQVIHITGEVNLTAGYHNLSGAAKAVATIVPLFWVIIIIGTGLAAIMYWMKKG